MLIEILIVFIISYLFYLYKTREVIMGANDKPYLIRYFLWRPKNGNKYYLHHIVQSDHDRSEHDHPFHFISIILLGGYTEVADKRQSLTHEYGWSDYSDYEKAKKFGPLSVLHRNATWKHKIILDCNKSAWTFVIRSPKIREWGFYTNNGETFCRHNQYDIKTGLCEDE